MSPLSVPVRTYISTSVVFPIVGEPRIMSKGQFFKTWNLWVMLPVLPGTGKDISIYFPKEEKSSEFHLIVLAAFVSKCERSWSRSTISSEMKLSRTLSGKMTQIVCCWPFTPDTIVTFLLRFKSNAFSLRVTWNNSAGKQMDKNWQCQTRLA